MQALKAPGRHVILTHKGRGELFDKTTMALRGCFPIREQPLQLSHRGFTLRSVFSHHCAAASNVQRTPGKPSRGRLPVNIRQAL